MAKARIVRAHVSDTARPLSTAIAAGDAYQRADGWATADLAGAAAVAARSQATLTIVDANGEVVAAPAER